MKCIKNVIEDMDNVSRINDRLLTMKRLHSEGIYIVLFMSPVFSGITDYKEIINATYGDIDEVWFKNLNLRGDYKKDIITYILENYPNYKTLYYEIYEKKSMVYWENLSKEMEKFCRNNNIKYELFFYHNKLVKQKNN